MLPRQRARGSSGIPYNTRRLGRLQKKVQYGGPGSSAIHINLANGYTVPMQRISFNHSSWLRLLTVMVWIILFCQLLRRDVFIGRVDLREQQTIEQAESEEYQSIYFKDSKIGFVVSSFKKGADNLWLLNQHALMKLNVAQSVQSIDLRLKATLTAGNILKFFTFSFHSPFYQMKAQGSVQGNSLSYTLFTGSSTIQDTLVFNSPPMLSTARRAYLLGGPIQPGEKKRIPWFDPASLTGKESILEYHGKEPVLINGRVQKLHRFSESFAGVKVNSWLNDSGVVVKEESPAGFVFLKEPKFRALNLPDSGKDILSAVAVNSTGQPIDISGKSVRYQLTLPDGGKFDLNGGRQQFTGNILTVRREEIPEDGASSNCSEIGDSLSPSPYIQSDSPVIADLARQITVGLIKPADRLRQLALWVYDNLEKRPVLGLPDALTTLNNRRGDCNEHTALFAALARSVAIPTRIVAGVTYFRQAFYYHAWNEVCLGDSWISIDTTTNQFPADLGHLRFVEGELQEQVRMGGLLGKLGIEQVEEKP